VEISGLKDGEYTVELWHTYETGKVEHDSATCMDGLLKVELPSVEKDAACKVYAK
jgi:hypothetical protein